MKNIDSPEKLLRLLAVKGDPTAFFLLIIPYAKSIYMSLRNNGIDHKNALEMLSPFIKKLYYDRATLSRAESSLEWQEKTEKKLRIAEQPQSAEVMLDHIVPPNAALFESDLQNFLMQIQNKERLGETPSPLQRRIRRLWIKSALYGAILLGIIAGAYGILTVTQVHICLTILGPHTAFSLLLPLDFTQSTSPAVQAARPDSDGGRRQQETLIVPPGLTSAADSVKTNAAPAGQNLQTVKIPLPVKPAGRDTSTTRKTAFMPPKKTVPPVKKVSVPAELADSPADSGPAQPALNRKTSVQGGVSDTNSTNRYPQY